MKVPCGTRNLFISCIDSEHSARSEHKQFQGIKRILIRLGAAPDNCLVNAQGERFDFRRRRTLTRVLLCGHGNERRPGFAVASDSGLKPEDLRLPDRASLYLLGCFQGSSDHRDAWARGTGISPNRVFGSSGETESALSTCLLLHLLEEGVSAIDIWFPVWRLCNRELRPYFPRIRRQYEKHAKDPVITLSELRKIPAVTGFEEFLGIIERYPAYLTGLM